MGPTQVHGQCNFSSFNKDPLNTAYAANLIFCFLLDKQPVEKEDERRRKKRKREKGRTYDFFVFLDKHPVEKEVEKKRKKERTYARSCYSIHGYS